jgi:NitT/TauT family transport system substrate-binding protein
MEKRMYFVKLIIILFVISSLAACSNSNSIKNTAKLSIAYQYGMAYAPLIIMQDQALIEKYYDGVEVEWSVLNSGLAINEGIIGGSIDIGAIGIAPFITGVTAGIPYKIYSGISSQPHGITTNNPKIKSLNDITSEDKIALVTQS